MPPTPSATTTPTTTRPPAPRRRAGRFGYLPNVLRLGFFCAFVAALVGAFALRAVAGNAREGLMSLGREMLRYSDHATDGPVQRVSLNGTELDFATGSTTDGVPHVLDEYARRCATRDGAVARQLAELADARPRARAAAVAPHGMTTVRAGDEHQGFVTCLDVGQARLSLDEIVRRLRSFALSSNVADVGRMRYVYAERAGNGRTRFVGFWSDGDVNLGQMFPAAGDAPGVDVPSVPRAPGLRRMLSAYELGQSYAMDIYTGASAGAPLEGFYRDAMPRSGWTLLPMRGAPELHGQTMLTYEKGATTVSLVFDHAGDAARTVTVLAGM